MPVRARVTRIAVLTRTDGSDSGLGPSRDGDQGPPIAIVSFLPRAPTRNWIARVGCTKLSLFVAPKETKTDFNKNRSVILDIIKNTIIHGLCQNTRKFKLYIIPLTLYYE